MKAGHTGVERDRLESIESISSPPNKGPAKSPRKRNLKKTRTSRISGIRSETWPGIRVDLFPEQECHLMERAEHQQTRTDRFWGKDKESRDCDRERANMEEEDKRSWETEAHYALLQDRARWEAEEKRLGMARAYDAALEEMAERKRYLQTVFSTRSSEAVMMYKWKTRDTSLLLSSPHQSSDSLVDEEKRGESIDYEEEMDMLRQQQYYDAVVGGGICVNRSNHNFGAPEWSSSIAAGSANMSLTLPDDDAQVRLSVHLDGMQQIRAISNGGGRTGIAQRDGNKQFTMGKSLRNRASEDVVDLAMSTSVAVSDGASANNADVKKSKLLKNVSSSTSTNLSFLKSQEEKMKIDRKLKAALNPQHVEATEGHIKYKWDQETILRVAFAKMSSASGKQHLFLSDLASKLPHNYGIQNLLKFTVFGAWIKKKQWHEFQNLFLHVSSIRVERGSIGEEEGYGNNHQQPLKSQLHQDTSLWMKVDEWVDSARRMAFESRKSRQQVRTEMEHFSIINDGNDNWSHILGQESTSGWYASLARKQLYSSERAAAIHRTINIGDCVWSLHGGGVMWLPASVTAIHENDESTGISYDLSYFMSHQELQQSRAVSSTRQLMMLPSDTPTLIPTQNPHADERSICNSIFELINADKNQVVNSNDLIAALKSKQMEKVVKCSVALSMIVFGSAPTHSCALSPTLFPLAEALLTQFPGGISKAEFIAFIEYALDLHSFNKAIIHVTPKSTVG